MGGNTSSSMPAASGKMPSSTSSYAPAPPSPEVMARYQQASTPPAINPPSSNQYAQPYAAPQAFAANAGANTPVPAAGLGQAATPAAQTPIAAAQAISNMATGKMPGQYASGGAANGFTPEQIREAIKKIMEG